MKSPPFIWIYSLQILSRRQNELEGQVQGGNEARTSWTSHGMLRLVYFTKKPRRKWTKDIKKTFSNLGGKDQTPQMDAGLASKLGLILNRIQNLHAQILQKQE